jgi:hypothetical protein
VSSGFVAACDGEAVVRQSPGGLDVALRANRVCRLLGVPADLTRRDRWPVQASVTKDSDGLVFGSMGMGC